MLSVFGAFFSVSEVFRAPMSEGPIVNYFEFHDLGEAIESIAHDQLQYRQLDRGSIHIKLAAHEFGDLSIVEANLDKRVDGQGVVSPGRVLFEVCLGGEEPHLYSSQEFGRGQIYVASGGGGGYQMLKPGYHAYCLYFQEETVERLNGGPVSSPQGAVWDICPHRFERVVGLCREFKEHKLEGPAATKVSEQLALVLLEGLLQEGSIPKNGLGSRVKLASRVRDLLELSNYSLADICAEVELSERAMRRVFSEFYGLSPVQYRLSLRLASVREELKGSLVKKGTVAAVAVRHGFWHMGRFGAQYRRQYQESPSDTLRRHGVR